MICAILRKKKSALIRSCVLKGLIILLRNTEDIEKKINDFLEKLHTNELIDIKYTYSYGGSVDYITAMIIYKVK